MIPWLRDLLYDPRSFANFIRAALFLAGELIPQLVPAESVWWGGKMLQGLALIIKAGDKNPRLPAP